MRRFILVAIGLISVCLWMSDDLMARGGRGGGGRGGGGGGYRGGGGPSRSPSMSRPSYHPSAVSRPSGASSSRPRSGYGSLPTPSTRPATGARPSTGARPATGARPSTAARPAIATPSGGARPGTQPAGGRPSRSDLGNFLDLPSGGSAAGGRPSTLPSRGAAAAGGAVAGGAAAAFLQDRPSQLPSGPGNRVDVGQPGRPDVGQPGRPDVGQPGRPDIGQPGRPNAGRPGTPRDNFAQNQPGRIENREQRQDWRHENRDDIRDYWQDNHGYFDDWFDGNWWNNGIADDIPYLPGFGYWTWAAWSGLAGWVDYGWSDPVYYNYGENVYYDDGSVYYGDQVVATEAEYAAQAEAIATSAPETPPVKEDWMPLGVFAMTADGQPTGALPTMFLQLAVSKQGVISGTFQNTATGAAQMIEGMVDKQTQRAAWTAEGQSRPLMETGIGNLTEDTTPVLIHFADGSTQQWLLVRMEKPEAAAAAATAPVPGAAPATPPATPPRQ